MLPKKTHISSEVHKRPQMTSQEAQITDINSRIYIMQKASGATLIILMKETDKLTEGGWGGEEIKKQNLQYNSKYVGCRRKQQQQQNNKKGVRTVRACQVISRCCTQLQRFPLKQF